MKLKLLSSFVLLLVFMIPLKSVSQTCITPTGLTTTSIGTTTATFNWVAPGNAYYYKIQYRPVTTPASAWTQATSQSTTLSLTSLTCGTPYEWQIESVCSTAGTGQTSPWSSSVTFTTATCPVNCVPPTGLVTSSITTTGSTLTWTAATGALAYTVQYRPVTTPASTWTNVTTQTTTISLTTLTCGTQYEWQVSSMCSTVSGGSSVYTASITFTTAACPVTCVPPTGLVTSNITTTSAILSWTAANNAYAYLVHYRPITTPASAWVSASTQSSDTIRLTGLTCNTQYEWQVANYCGSGTTSVYTSSMTFTTAACPVNCVPPTGLVMSNITTTGATLTWTAATGALAYTVQYRPVTTPASTWTNVTTQTTTI